MLRIIKSTEPLSVERINVCIYSPPGLGKTTLGFTAEDPILFDCDKGAYRAPNRKDTVPVSTWADIATFSAADLTPYKTVVVDTAGRALDFLTTDIIAANPKMGRGGALTLQGYGELKSKFTAWLKMLRQSGKDVVLIAHMDEQRSGDDVIERLDVQGGSKGEIYKSVDAMGRIFMRNGQRFIDFSPRENSFGKNPCNLEVTELNLGNDQLLAYLIATIKKRLNGAAEQQKAAEDRLKDWQSVISEFKTVEDVNARLAEIEKSGPQVVSMTNKKAKDMGLVFDKKSRSFCAPAPPPAREVESAVSFGQ